MKHGSSKNKYDEIEIDIDDVKLILGNEFAELHEYLETSFCGECPDHNTTLENYKIYLDKLNFLVFRGQCFRCKNPVTRCIETDEPADVAEMARHIRTIKKKFKIGTKK